MRSVLSPPTAGMSWGPSEAVEGLAEAQAALRSSEDRFARAFRSSPAALSITRRCDGRFVEANPAFLRLTGFSRDELVGRTAVELGISRVQPEREALIDQLRATGRVHDLETSIHTRDGDRRLIRLSMEPIELDGLPHMIATIVDVTAGRIAEEALRASEARFRQLAESIHEVFWLTDAAKNQMRYVSPAYEAIWGRSCASLYASPRDWLEAIHPEDRARVVRAALEQQVTGTYEEEYRITRPDGATRWIRDRAFPVHDERGGVIGVAGVAEDVTARRHLEEQLRQTQKLESIGLLAGGVAHDFNNLLTIIGTCAELMANAPPLATPELELIDEIRGAVARATSLTGQLLAFSRKELVSPRLLDLNVLVHDTERMLRRLLGEDIALTLRAAAVTPRVNMDPNHLVQILLNLAVNARDAMPRGGTLTISTAAVELDEGQARRWPRARPGTYATLTVSDSGCGMSSEIRERVFEPFFTTKGPGKGTGLGLAVTHGIVEQSGGHIELESEAGVGTTFRILLPAAPASTIVLSRDVVRNDNGNERILFVEDDDGVGWIAARALRSRGYHVLRARTGEDAIRVLAAEDGRVDLVVTDVVMPGIDGPELAEVAIARYPWLRVLFTSGYTDDAVLRHGLPRADVRFLQKPYAVQTMARRVREVLDEPCPPSPTLVWRGAVVEGA